MGTATEGTAADIYIAFSTFSVTPNWMALVGDHHLHAASTTNHRCVAIQSFRHSTICRVSLPQDVLKLLHERSHSALALFRLSIDTVSLTLDDAIFVSEH